MVVGGELDALAGQAGYVIRAVTVEAHGLCAACREQD